MGLYSLICSIGLAVLCVVGWRNFIANLHKTFATPPDVQACLYSLSRQCDFTHKITGMYGGDYYSPISAYVSAGLFLLALTLLLASERLRRKERVAAKIA